MKVNIQYRWCYYCEEAGPDTVDTFWPVFCPLCGWGNGLPGDSLSWTQFQEAHPYYPLVPEARLRYPLENPETKAAMETDQRMMRRTWDTPEEDAAWKHLQSD